MQVFYKMVYYLKIIILYFFKYKPSNWNHWRKYQKIGVFLYIVYLVIRLLGSINSLVGFMSKMEQSWSSSFMINLFSRTVYWIMSLLHRMFCLLIQSIGQIHWILYKLSNCTMLPEELLFKYLFEFQYCRMRKTLVWYPSLPNHNGISLDPIIFLKYHKLKCLEHVWVKFSHKKQSSILYLSLIPK